ncbi:MAG: carbohydrate ABC transporter permease [Clostridiales bacterium]|jgi:putative aldouronate transport system permease protein|nr:carbohydrate ABC transporter permease [Clostridiales bacterium]
MEKSRLDASPGAMPGGAADVRPSDSALGGSADADRDRGDRNRGRGGGNDGGSAALGRFGLFDALNYAFLAALCVSMIYPFWDLLMRSFASPADSMSVGFKLMPSQWSVAAYRVIFESGDIFVNYWNTIFRAVVGTGLSLVVTSACAYGLSRRTLPFRNGITLFFIFTMFFGGGLIPGYMLIRDLGLIDTIWSLIVPGVASVYNMIILRNNFQGLDAGLEESAMLDGANKFTILFRIVLPVSKPILATIGLWCMVGHWNAWFDALLYTNKPSLSVLQLALHNLLTRNQSSEMQKLLSMSSDASKLFTPMSAKAAQIFVTIVPILATYPFLQKYFVKGILVGSFKG